MTVLVLLDSRGGKDDPLYRTTVDEFDFEYRFLVGGQYEYAAHDNLWAGKEYNPSESTTLTAGLEWDDTEITVADTTGFELGVVLVHPHTHPNADNEEYELIAYNTKTGTKFQDLTRGAWKRTDEESPPYQHTIGATVSEWVEITEKVSTFVFTETFADGVSTWQVAVNGFFFNEKLLARDNGFLALVRYRPFNEFAPDNWTEWMIAWVGYINSSNATDDYAEARSWTAQVEGIGQYVAASDIPAQHFGINDVAEGKSVIVSSYIEDPELVANTGEFIGSPDLGGAQIVDGDNSTLWISYDAPSSTVPSRQENGIIIAEVYIAEHKDGVGPWWIEFYNGSDESDYTIQRRTLVHKGTQWKTVSWPSEDDPDTIESWRVVNGNHLTFSRFPSRKVGPYDFFIITSDVPKFRERWNVGSNTTVLDWDKLVKKGVWIPDPSGDLFAMHMGGLPRSLIWYGDVTPYDYMGDGSGSFWTGNTVNVPKRGRSMARVPWGNNTNAASGWDDDEDAPTPGYRRTGDAEWFEIDLGNLNIELDGALAADEFDEAILSGTLGLREGPATIKVDAEVIIYATIDRENNKILTLTRYDPVAHPDAAPVVPYEDYEEMDMHLVKGFSWARRTVLDSSGKPIVPRNYDIFVSTFDDPPHHDAWGSDWDEWWDRHTIVRSNEATYWDVAFEPRRVRHVLMAIYDMSDDGRAKMNTFNAWAATTNIISGEDGTTTEEDGLTYSGDIVKYILTERFGLPEGNFIMTDRGSPFRSVPTTKSRALDVIRDLCNRTGCAVKFYKDGRIEHMHNPHHPMARLPGVWITWDRDSARDIGGYAKAFMHNVSQVKLYASNETTGDQFEVSYPTTALDLGSEKKIQDVVLGSVQDAILMAQLLFQIESGLPEVSITPKGLGEWISTCQRHIVNWTVDVDETTINDMDFIVEGVSLNVGFGNKTGWKTWDLTVDLTAMAF